jgi:hypothetical protein
VGLTNKDHGVPSDFTGAVKPAPDLRLDYRGHFSGEHLQFVGADDQLL